MRFSLRRWWQLTFASALLRDGSGRRGPRRFRPAAELLETRALPSVQLVSRALPTGLSLTPAGDSFDASVSADGRFVAFRSNATDLTTGQQTGGVFVYDRLQGTTTLVAGD